eukprot:scaffold494_cov245-Pinguiococcus_pyrenoidosus.AAC.5
MSEPSSSIRRTIRTLCPPRGRSRRHPRPPAHQRSRPTPRRRQRGSSPRRTHCWRLRRPASTRASTASDLFKLVVLNGGEGAAGGQEVVKVRHGTREGPAAVGGTPCVYRTVCPLQHESGVGVKHLRHIPKLGEIRAAALVGLAPDLQTAVSHERRKGQLVGKHVSHVGRQVDVGEERPPAVVAVPPDFQAIVDERREGVLGMEHRGDRIAHWHRGTADVSGEDRPVRQSIACADEAKGSRRRKDSLYVANLAGGVAAPQNDGGAHEGGEVGLCRVQRGDAARDATGDSHEPCHEFWISPRHDRTVGRESCEAILRRRDACHVLRRWARERPTRINGAVGTQLSTPAEHEDGSERVDDVLKSTRQRATRLRGQNEALRGLRGGRNEPGSPARGTGPPWVPPSEGRLAHPTRWPRRRSPLCPALPPRRSPEAGGVDGWSTSGGNGRMVSPSGMSAGVAAALTLRGGDELNELALQHAFQTAVHRGRLELLAQRIRRRYDCRGRVGTWVRDEASGPCNGVRDLESAYVAPVLQLEKPRANAGASQRRVGGHLSHEIDVFGLHVEDDVKRLHESDLELGYCQGVVVRERNLVELDLELQLGHYV